jgi:hypothetical protein
MTAELSRVSFTPQELIRFIECRTCPACGDTTHRRICDNHSGTCGIDWRSQYKEAKEANAREGRRVSKTHEADPRPFSELQLKEKRL